MSGLREMLENQGPPRPNLRVMRGELDPREVHEPIVDPVLERAHRRRIAFKLLMLVAAVLIGCVYAMGGGQ